MIKTSLDAYGSGNRPATVQNIAGGQNALMSPAGSQQPIPPEPKSVGKGEVSKVELDAAVKKLNELVSPSLQSVEFSVDQESDRMVVKVVDTETKATLRQIPNEEVLAISKTLDKLQGLVIRQTA